MKATCFVLSMMNSFRSVVDNFREIFPKISTSATIEDTISPDLLYEWYNKFPYDFALWSWAIKSSAQDL